MKSCDDIGVKYELGMFLIYAEQTTQERANTLFTMMAALSQAPVT